MHPYVQHDWSPAMWAMMLTVLASVVVVGMGLFLVAAQRPKHEHGG